MPRLEVRRLDAHRLPDFWALHSDANGHGWCRCVAWWVPTWDGWAERTAEANVTLRQGLFDAGIFDGYLGYEGDVPVAWSQAWPLGAFPKLLSSFDLEAGADDWMIGCFVVAPARRRLGVAAGLLDGVLEDLATRGASQVFAFPKRGSDLDQDDLWNGPESMLRNAGFTLVRDDPSRPVLRWGAGSPPP